MKRGVLILLRLYQSGLSPFLGSRCRFSPSCSAYLHEAIAQRGLVKGLCLGLRRLLRCHPFSDGGYDPVQPGSPS